jgi:transcriptional regulator with XRE-family HTH domain
MKKSKPTLPKRVVSMEEIDHKVAGELIRKARLQRGLSLRSLAETMKISAPHLSDLERGNPTWTVKRFNQVLAILFDMKEK